MEGDKGEREKREKRESERRVKEGKEYEGWIEMRGERCSKERETREKGEGRDEGK